jgi:Fe-S oxidoreductase
MLQDLAPPGLEGPTEEDLRSAAECAHCGACITVCPAYLADKTELVTARGKLLAMEKMARGETLDREDAWGLFDCIHCSACTNVCQSAIDLVPVWDRLENLVTRRYGKPRERLEAFAKRVEAEEEYHDLVNRGLAYAIQTPRGRHRDV